MLPRDVDPERSNEMAPAAADRQAPAEASAADDLPFVADFVERNEYAGWSLFGSTVYGALIGGLTFVWLPHVGCVLGPAGALLGGLIGFLLAYGAAWRKR